MSGLEVARIVAAFALFGLGAAGLFLGYAAVEDAGMTVALAVAFITAAVGALGIKVQGILANRKNNA